MEAKELAKNCERPYIATVWFVCFTKRLKNPVKWKKWTKFSPDLILCPCVHCWCISCFMSKYVYFYIKIQIKTCMLGVSSVSTLDQGTGSESGVIRRALHCGCPLLLREGLNTENTFHGTLCMWLRKYLYLYLYKKSCLFSHWKMFYIFWWLILHSTVFQSNENAFLIFSVIIDTSLPLVCISSIAGTSLPLFHQEQSQLVQTNSYGLTPKKFLPVWFVDKIRWELESWWQDVLYNRDEAVMISISRGWVRA